MKRPVWSLPAMHTAPPARTLQTPARAGGACQSRSPPSASEVSGYSFKGLRQEGAANPKMPRDWQGNPPPQNLEPTSPGVAEHSRCVRARGPISAGKGMWLLPFLASKTLRAQQISVINEKENLSVGAANRRSHPDQNWPSGTGSRCQGGHPGALQGEQASYTKTLT